MGCHSDGSILEIEDGIVILEDWTAQNVEGLSVLADGKDAQTRIVTLTHIEYVLLWSHLEPVITDHEVEIGEFVVALYKDLPLLDLIISTSCLAKDCIDICIKVFVCDSDRGVACVYDRVDRCFELPWLVFGVFAESDG